MGFFVVLALLCIGIGFTVTMCQYIRGERTYKRQQKQIARQEYEMQMETQRAIQEQINRYQNELKALYHNLDLLYRLEEVQKTDTTSEKITEVQIKNQIATQKQIANLNHQIADLEAEIALLEMEI